MQRVYLVYYTMYMIIHNTVYVLQKTMVMSLAAVMTGQVISESIGISRLSDAACLPSILHHVHDYTYYCLCVTEDDGDESSSSDDWTGDGDTDLREYGYRQALQRSMST